MDFQRQDWCPFLCVSNKFQKRRLPERSSSASRYSRWHSTSVRIKTRCNKMIGDGTEISFYLPPFRTTAYMRHYLITVRHSNTAGQSLMSQTKIFQCILSEPTQIPSLSQPRPVGLGWISPRPVGPGWVNFLPSDAEEFQNWKWQPPYLKTGKW